MSEREIYSGLPQAKRMREQSDQNANPVKNNSWYLQAATGRAV